MTQPRTPKWPFIVMVAILALFLLYVAGTQDKSDPAMASPAATEQTPVPTPTPAPVETVEISTPVPTLPSGPSKEEVFDIIQESAYENMSQYISSMTFEDNVCLIVYNVEGATLAAQQNSKDWRNVVDNTVNLTIQQYKAFSSYGYDDVQCAITILNEFNTENVLLLVVNGDIMYNAGDE